MQRATNSIPYLPVVCILSCAATLTRLGRDLVAPDTFYMYKPESNLQEMTFIYKVYIFIVSCTCCTSPLNTCERQKQ